MDSTMNGEEEKEKNDDSTPAEGEEASSFESAFEGLAFHLFPDGCPVTGLQSAWPVRTTRGAVSVDGAWESIRALRNHAARRGLTAAAGHQQGQMEAVSFAARRVLLASSDQKKSGGGGGGGADTAAVHSPLLLQHKTDVFVSLVRSLLPAAAATAAAESQEIVPETVIRQLLSSASAAAAGGKSCPPEAVSAVLRFLTLAVNGDGDGDGGATVRHVLRGLYGAIFHHALRPATAVDAVRLLGGITLPRHATEYRARRLGAACDRAVAAAAVGTRRSSRLSRSTARKKDETFAAMTATQLEDVLSATTYLLDLFGRLHPACREYAVRTQRHCSTSGCWQSFPDQTWLTEFHARGRRETNAGRRQQQQRRRWDAAGLWVDCWRRSSARTGSKKRPRQDLVFVLQGRPCSDVLRDPVVQHAVSLASSSPSDREVPPPLSECMAQLRAALPSMLSEEWCPADLHTTCRKGEAAGAMDEDAPSLRLLSALAEFASKTDGLLPEMEHFLIHDVLPVWDGSSCDRMGELLCHGLLPYLRPRSLADLRAAGVVYHLEKLFVYGAPSLQYTMVSGTLALLLRRWSHTDWSPSSVDGDPSAIQTKAMRELIQWVDDLLLKGFLAETHRGDGQELLRAACIDFYSTVCELLAEHLAFVATPSPSVLYELLLSSSALHVDKVCELLVSYKESIETWKARRQHQHSMDVSSKPLTQSDDAERGRIKVFNCFIWDFCSVLWRCTPPPPPNEGTLSILYTDLRPETQAQLHTAANTVAKSLSITHGAVFMGYVADFLRENPSLLPNGQQPSPDLVRGNVKVQYLDYLKQRGLCGVHAFLFTFIGSLASRGDKQEK
jgi:hypothetical protein